jgi:hypothetical protein
VSLKDLLVTLTGAEKAVDELLATASVFKDANVGFNHFMDASSGDQSLTANHVFSALQRYSGLRMPPGFPDTDFLLVAMLKTGSIGLVKFQVRNRQKDYQGKHAPIAASWKNNKCASDELKKFPSVGIHMSLSSNKQKPEWICYPSKARQQPNRDAKSVEPPVEPLENPEEPTKNPKDILCLVGTGGLDAFPNLVDEEKKLLKYLLDMGSNSYGIFDEKMLAQIKRFDPAIFTEK